MKRFIRSITIAFMCGILVVPVVDAQERRGSRGSHRTENTTSGRRSTSGRQQANRGNRPGQRPAYSNQRYNRPPRHIPMAKPHRPPVRHYHRPVPPPSFRPHRGCPVIHGILGITFGTAINISLNYLQNRGYVVDGYTGDVVYLRNVNEMSFLWPDATLYYGTNGLIGSQFSYSTNYYDRTRYN